MYATKYDYDTSDYIEYVSILPRCPNLFWSDGLRGSLGVFFWLERGWVSACAPVSCWRCWALPPLA
jgi:hypothetical protein